MAERSDEATITTVADTTTVEPDELMLAELDGMGQGAEDDNDPTGAQTVNDEEE